MRVDDVKQVLVLPIATIIVLILIIGLTSEATAINTQRILAEIGMSSIKSRNSDEHPTISECKATTFLGVLSSITKKHVDLGDRGTYISTFLRSMTYTLPFSNM